jgi:hypothetical protein
MLYYAHQFIGVRAMQITLTKEDKQLISYVSHKQQEIISSIVTVIATRAGATVTDNTQMNIADDLSTLTITEAKDQTLITKAE